MAVIQLPRRVEIARPVITVTTLGKDHAFPAVQENLVILLALLNVNLVLKIRIMVTKEEIQLAFHVKMVGRRKKVALNAKFVEQVRLAMGAKAVLPVSIVQVI